ncbi:hypothetical protein KFE25_002142 [Diacronema lutheri]|uniref:NOL1/NOP2/Sun domain family member 4 n=1 Tax=Diacronema lutheri TaxID=2081491 RepID=A0A8J6CCR3_DIALT|nr:hypothetical protein KFE25_002142 [Diacronema lutheri]
MPPRGKKPPAHEKPRPLEVVAEEYERHFRAHFGARWPALRTALLSPCVHAALANKRYGAGAPAELADGGAEALPLALACCRRRARGETFAPPPADASGLLAYYLIDAAALLAVEALDISPGDQVLDVCSAPGGKAVAILQHLDLSRGQLVCNDASAERCARLRRVLGQYVPREQSAAVRVTQHDGAAHSAFGRLFTRVLVDAPCSTDRHLLQNTLELQRWTTLSPAKHAERQLSLLCRALQAARSPAVVVYTTSALDARENDGVVRAALQRFPERVRVRAASQMPFGEPTPLGGWLVLPDTSGGWGPAYFAALLVADVAAPLPPPEPVGDGGGDDSSDDGSDASTGEEGAG